MSLVGADRLRIEPAVSRLDHLIAGTTRDAIVMAGEILAHFRDAGGVERQVDFRRSQSPGRSAKSEFSCVVMKLKTAKKGAPAGRLK